MIPPERAQSLVNYEEIYVVAISQQLKNLYVYPALCGFDVKHSLRYDV